MSICPYITNSTPTKFTFSRYTIGFESLEMIYFAKIFQCSYLLNFHEARCRRQQGLVSKLKCLSKILAHLERCDWLSH